MHSTSIDLQELRLKIDLRIINHSEYDLGVSTLKLLNLKEIQFFIKRDHSFIGRAAVNISGLEIPTKGYIDIRDIQAHVPLKSIPSTINLFTDVEKELAFLLVFESK